jgi:phospholipase/carboxylesterase
VTINNGYRMRAWYDILGLDGPVREDGRPARVDARRARLIERERARGIAANRIVLAGCAAAR